MKSIKIAGTALFIIGLLVFVASLSMSNYSMSPEIVEKSVKSVTSKIPHTEAIVAASQDMMGKTYTSKFAFLSDISKALNEAQNNVKDITPLYNNQVGDLKFWITKFSSTGLLSESSSWMFFLLSIVLASLGGLIYYLPDLKTLPGIKNNHIYHAPMTNRGWLGIATGIGLITFYVFLYWWPEYITNWTTIVDPIAFAVSGGYAGKWFLYGFLYCVVMVVMGVRMAMKYRHNKYQLVRTGSVVFFQLGFAFLIPNIMTKLNQPYMDFKMAWPLDYSYFYDYKIDKTIGAGADIAFAGMSTSVGTLMFIWGIILSLILVPLFTYFYGKRWYCSWVCGCGGLAETLGDPYRQLSDKSLKAWRIERYLIHIILVLVVLLTAVTITNYYVDNAILGSIRGDFQKWYGFLIGSTFSGVVGTGFYPLMGNRVWCRFGCPLAAILGIVQKFKSRFRITTNGGQCISCGNCSTYCEMGIDVRSYAQKGQDIVRASCVGCGICSAVCPRGVLRLENSSEDINERADDNRTIHISADAVTLLS